MGMSSALFKVSEGGSPMPITVEHPATLRLSTFMYGTKIAPALRGARQLTRVVACKKKYREGKNPWKH